MQRFPDLGNRSGSAWFCFFRIFSVDLTWRKKGRTMSKTYYDPEDLKKFGEVSEWNKELADQFFSYYEAVFKEGSLTEREKALIALAVSHTIQCPYCIDAYSEASLEKGSNEEEMMEAVHVGTAIRGGASLVHGVQMMNKGKKLSM
jgi:alkylhydroperoxidase/carboxymuconolactone decarboxylase family protein